MDTEGKSIPSDDPNGYCRLCFSDRNLVSLFGYDAQHRQQWLDEISNCTGVKIEANENRPSSICWRCAVAVEDFQLFRKRCLANDAIIQSKYSNTVVKHGNVEWLISIPVSEHTADLISDENDSLLEPMIKPQSSSESNHEELTSEKINGLNADDSQIARSVSCHLCRNEFGTRQSLYVHFKEQHSEHGRPFKCDLCQATFKRKSHLDDHVSSHTGEVRYACKFCGEKFLRAKPLMRHRKNCHKEFPLKIKPSKSQPAQSEGQFKCNYCPKSFKHRPSLNFHVKSHYDLLPFVCEQCDARFVSNNGLLIHRGKHHPDTVNAFRTVSPASLEPIKRVKCTLCTRNFGEQRYLLQHMRFMHPKESEGQNNQEAESGMAVEDPIEKQTDVNTEPEAVTIKFEVEDNDDEVGYS
ncbi:zinc finger protein ZFP2-like [Aedes albopictus]|uniref:C2h2-type zn-finger protein n=1 Tax=Aedes albopictus TaxID=7160 RepID=A0ABM1Y9N1_AEDAL